MFQANQSIVSLFHYIPIFITSEDSLNAPDTPGSLDQAIESGNWEQVAASAAKYVMDHDESLPSSTPGVEV